MSNHTPTPWKLEIFEKAENGIRGIISQHSKAGSFDQIFHLLDIREDDIGTDEAKANAKFIVKAVNCHEELVKAINTALLILIKPNTIAERNAKEVLEQALAKAGE
jgi:hypothetical protein